MIKILHTADWHLGQMLCNFDRREEQQAMLDQMPAIVRQEQPDVFLLAGDIYDAAQPSAAVQKMFNDAILNLHHICPEMTIVCISGNHDSGIRHTIYQKPWEDLQVHMTGTIQREHPEEHIIEIAGKGFVVAVPYASHHLLPDGFYQSLYDTVAQRNSARLPVVLTAHLALSSCDPTGNDIFLDTIGGLECADASDFSRYDYVALGHIHKPQYVGSAQRIRYAGTPLPVSFDEVYPGCEHSVSIVEISHSGDLPSVRTIAINNPRPLVNLYAHASDSLREVQEALLRLPQDSRTYIRLNAEVPQGQVLPYTDGEIRHFLQEHNPCAQFCYINAIRKTPPAVLHSDDTANSSLSLTEFQHLQPAEVLARWFASRGTTYTDEHRQMFRQAEARLNIPDQPLP